MLNVLLIVEGSEEKTFFEIVKEHGIKNDVINLTIVNPEGAMKIPALFQDALSNDRYDAVYCVYDVDNRPHVNDSAFCMVKKKLKDVLGSIHSVQAISLCTNPNILLLYLLGPTDLSELEGKLKCSKEDNTGLVHKYWNEIRNSHDKKYDAAKWQLDIMKYSYDGKYSYQTLLARAKELSTGYEIDNCTSNIGSFLEALDSGNLAYFKKAQSIKKGR